CPRGAKAVRPNEKSDRRDALEVCDGLRCGVYHFVRLKTGEANPAKRLLRTAGLPTLARSLTTATAWEKLLKAAAFDATLRTFCRAHRRPPAVPDPVLDAVARNGFQPGQAQHRRGPLRTSAQASLPARARSG